MLIALLGLICAAPAECRAEGFPRVVIIGFDGADARLVERYMQEGKLPHLQKLRDDGGYAPLMPTNPPQTPVSWSAFATGKNPGKTGIFDFLKRLEPGSYLPTLAFTTETRRPFLWGPRNALRLALIAGAVIFVVLTGALMLLKVKRTGAIIAGAIAALLAGAGAHVIASDYLPEHVPWAQNNRQGATLWELVAAKGEPTQVIRVPQNFPATQVPGGQVLSGLGVPDMRGRVGTPSFYTSEPGFKVTDNEFSVEVINLPERTGTIQSVSTGSRTPPRDSRRPRRGAPRRRPSARWRSAAWRAGSMCR
jgi:hypothetical protein